MAKYFLYNLLFVFQIIFSINQCAGQNGSVSGTVRGNESVLVFATVTLGNKSILTDEKGEFHFSLPPGIYTLIITHAGYQKIEEKLKVDRGINQRLEFILRPAELMDEVMIGSRSLIQRSNLKTAVPIDVFPSKLLVQTGQTSLTQMLNFAAPSLNASRQVVNEPVTLRGLDPDQVLILVNGKRYHSMAYVNHGGVRGILGRGSVANDLNSIPFSAIEKIEILRDGASAQYGSDAIAGVINIILKKSVASTSINLHAGQFYQRDGENFSFGINQGIALRKKKLSANTKGYLNLSAYFRHINPTYRGGEYKGTVYVNNVPQDDSITRARNFNRKKVSNAGSSEHTSFGVLMNGAYPVNDHMEVFWTTSINERKTIFLSPHTLPKFPARVNPALFPDGFQAKPGHNSGDVYGIAGIRGETKKQWHWEYGFTYGSNNDKYSITNTNNASQFFLLNKNAPSSFYTGTLIFQQFTNTIHLSKNLSANKDRLLNLGFGAEWRREKFQIIEGEEASWKNYDSTLRKQGGAQNALVFQPGDAVKENRNVLGAYLDLEAEIKDRFLFDLAGRYEYYNDFGGNFAGKLAIRYKISEKFSVRSSLSNGFRAPSLQQHYYGFTTRTLTSNGGLIVPVTRGIFPNNSKVTRAFGIPSLNAETSINLGAGLITTILNRISVTVDAYWIQIKNRIVLSGNFDTTNAQVKEILRDIPDVDRLQFFANAINTSTQGVDIVINGNWKIKKATLLVMFGANFNRTKLFGEIKSAGKLRSDSLNNNTLFGRAERGRMEMGQPGDKIILSSNL